MTILAELRPEVYALVATLPFPNRMLGPFGNEDLQMYDRF